MVCSPDPARKPQGTRCLSRPDLLLSAPCPRGPRRLSPMARSHSFMWLSDIHCVGARPLLPPTPGRGWAPGCLPIPAAGPSSGVVDARAPLLPVSSLSPAPQLSCSLSLAPLGSPFLLPAPLLSFTSRPWPSRPLCLCPWQPCPRPRALGNHFSSRAKAGGQLTCSQGGGTRTARGAPPPSRTPACAPLHSRPSCSCVPPFHRASVGVQ